jgi:hypothetical protein
MPRVDRVGTQVLRWDPCRTIRYQIDPRGGIMTFTPDIHEAFRAASMASGIRVQYAGRGNARAPHQDGIDPVLVSYGYAGGAAGWGEAAVRGDEIVGGTIVLDPNRLGNSRRYHRRITFHEVGHIFGLQHPAVGRTAQVMGTASAPYRSADLAGFRMVGRRPGECR